MLPAIAPPFSPMVTTRNGTQRVGRWDTALGVAARMLLGWDDHDVAEWCLLPRPLANDPDRFGMPWCWSSLMW